MAVRKSVRERLEEHKTGKASTSKTTTGSNTGSTLTTERNSTRESVSDRLAKHKAGKVIGFDTFDSDLASVSETISKIYGGWQDADTMKNTKDSVAKMYERVNAANTYVGDNSLGDLVSGYKSVLDNWDNVAGTYSQFQNADAYSSAKKNYELSEKYKGLDYAGVQKAMVDSEDDEWLSQYGVNVGYSSLKDYNTELENLAKKMASVGGEEKKSLQAYYDKLEAKKNQYEMDHKFDLYKDVMQNEDFADKSMYVQNDGGGVFDWLLDTDHRAINEDAENEKSYFKQSTSERFDSLVSGLFGTEGIEYMTDEERKVYNYLYNTEGEKSALNFLNDMGITLAKRKTDARNKSVEEATNSLGAFSNIVGSALSVPWAIAGNVASFATDVNSKLLGMEYNPYSSAHALSNTAETIRDTTRGNIEEATDKYGIDILGKNAASFLYDTGLSLSESLLGAKGIGKGFDVIMGMGAASSTAKDLYESGANEKDIIAASLLSGGAEMLFEHWELEKFLNIKDVDTIGQVIKSAIFQTGSEALGEMGTELTNVLTDWAVRGGASDYAAMVEQFVRSGYTEEEAKKKAQTEIAKQIGLAGIGGAISGGIMGTIESGMQYGANKNLGSVISENNNVDTLADIARGTNNDAYSKYLELIDKGTASKAQIGNLYGKASEEVENNYQSERTNAELHAIANRATEFGETENSGIIATAVRKKLNNQSLSSEERTALQSDTAKTIMQEINRGEITTKRTGAFKDAYDTKTKMQSVLTEPKSKEAVRVKERVAELNTGEETMDNESGQKIEIKGMHKDEEGNTVLQTSEGERLLSAVTLSDHTAEIVATAEGMDDTKADTFVSLYQEGMDVEEYKTSFELAFSYGQHGFGTENVLKNKGVLTEEQAATAYEAGIHFATEARQKQRDELTEKYFSGVTPGNFDDSAVDYSKINTTQKAAIDISRMLSKATGVNVVFFQSEADENGHRAAENGRFDRSTNTIYIDTYAGVTENIAKDTIIPTLSHETTHWMKDKAPEAYNKLSGVVMDVLSKEYGVSPVDMVHAEMKRYKDAYGKEVSEEYAQDELIARACEDMLSGNRNVQELVSQMDEKTAKTFSERLKVAFEKIKEWLTDLLKTYKSNSEEAKIVRKYADKVNELQAAWDETFDKAIKANQTMKSSEETMPMAASDRTQYSERNNTSFAEQYDAWDKKDIRKTFTIGVTSGAMAEIGIEKRTITFDAVKLLRVLKEHPQMTDAIIKQIPEIINDPVLILQSKQSDSRIVLTGEVYDTDGNPVIVVLELHPKGKNGIELDEIKVASAYGKKKMQTLIDTSKILYVNKDKTKTNRWLKNTRLQLPFDSTPVGSKDILPSNDSIVKSDGKNSTQFSERDSEGNGLTKAQVEYFKNSKVRDENGNLKVMYHGTSKGGFTTFDKAFSDDGRSLFFTDSVKVAKGYSGTYEEIIPNKKLSVDDMTDIIYDSYTWVEHEDGEYRIIHRNGEKYETEYSNKDYDEFVAYLMEEYGSSEVSGNYKVYLNIENPLVVDADGSNWDELPSIDDREFMTTRDYAEYAEANGYDGVIINDVFDIAIYASGSEKLEPSTVVVAFDSNQIKSVYNENPSGDADIRYSERDSNGNGLTKEQVEYFKESKVRDAEDNLLVMYHGTPNAGFTKFRSGTYFTEHKWYADVYQSPGASSLGYKKSSDNPDTYAVYLNITKPFDTRNKAERDIFYNEYYQQWGTGTDLMESGLPDWLDGEDMKEFLEEKGYDYDGLILDEGGVGGYGDEVISRGVSYVVFNPSQVKNIDNQHPTEDEDIRYSERNTESIYDAVGELKRLQKENEKLKKDVERLRQRNRLEHTVTGGTVLNENQIASVASYLLKNADSTYSKEQLTEELKDIYKYLQSDDVTWDILMLKATDIAQRIVAEKRERTVPNDYAKEILSVLRTTKVSLNETQKAEAKYAYGKDWYKMFFGRVLITNDGIPLDSMWQQWAQMYPDIFDADMSDVDMATEVLNVYDAVKASSEIVEAYDTAEMVRDIAVEIYNQFWNVSPVRTLADKYEREIANLKHEKSKAIYEKKLAAAQKYDQTIKQLKYEHRVEMKDMKARYNQRKTEAVYQTKERYQKTIKEMKEKRAEEIRQIREKSKEYNQAYRDRLMRKAEIDKITKKALKLNTWLVKNSKEAHVPEILKKPVAAVLKSLNFSSERLLGLRGGEQAGTPTNKDISLSKAFEDLADVVGSVNDAQINDKELDGMYGHLDLPTDFVEFVRKTSGSINDLLRAVGDNEYILNEMSLEQLKDVNNILNVLTHTVTQTNKALAASHGKSIAALSQDTMLYANEQGKHSKLVGGLTDFFNFSNALPYYAFRRFGEGGKYIFEAFQDGWDKFAFHVKRIMDYSNETYTAKEVKEWQEQVHEFDVMNGKEEVHVKMTTAQIMSLYCLQKREQAKGHLIGGGIRVADFKEGKGKVTQPEGVTLQENDINDIISKLTDRQIEVADNLQEFMNTVCTDWGNEVSMIRFGYKAFGEPNYFPIKSDSNNHAQDDAKEQENSLFRLLNMSFTKGTIKNANSRVVIDNIFDVFASHTSDMAKYNALALPVLDAFKWYNYKEKVKVNPADKNDKRFVTNGVKQSMERAYGAGAKKYVVQFLRDINGANSGGIEGAEQFAKKLMANYKVASVGANLRVAVLQPTSYIRASILMDAKYLTKAFTRKPQIEKARETCGITLWKSMGFYDTNISKGVSEQIKHDDSVMDKVREGSMKLAEWGDSMTWGYLYNACEAEVSDKQPGLTGKAKEEAIAKRLREVIYATQVVDSTMTRTQMMRSKSTWMQMATSFMSEPMISYNLLHDCFMQYNTDKRITGSKGTALKRNGKKITRAMLAYTMATFASALAGALPDTLREDDEEEDFAEVFVSNAAENAVSDALGMIPLFKDVVSLFQGYDVARMDTQSFASIVRAYQSVSKAVENGEITYKTVYNVVRAVSQATGIPVSNLMRDAVAIWNSTIGENYDSVKLK